MKIDYLSTLREMGPLCARFKNEVVRLWFTSSSGKLVDYAAERDYCYAPKYRAYYDDLARTIEVSELLGIASLEPKREGLRQVVHYLADPENIRGRANLEGLVTKIMNAFSLKVQTEINSLTSNLSANETERLDEALHCYLEGCYFSTVAMAVTAIEYRLLQWMKKVNPSDAALDGLTLGQLVGKCLTEEPYKSLLPKKYQPLLQLCNEYRVFSVHAKSEPINKRVASSVLTLSMEFLFDSSLLGTRTP
jgi:hypothetical protein